MYWASKIEKNFIVQVTHAINGESIILAIFDTRSEAYEYKEQLEELIKTIDSEYDKFLDSGLKDWQEHLNQHNLPDNYTTRLYWANPQVKEIINNQL